MKNKHLIFVLAMLMSMVASVASAYDAKINGIYYNFTGRTATVTYICGRYDSSDNGKYYKGNIVIPDKVDYNGHTYSVTSIGEDAFNRCSGLTSITIPNSVTEIGYAAFHGCSGLTSITIPNSVTSIGDAAFYYCSGLTSIIIPKSVTSIGEDAFSCCSSLTSIVVERYNPKYDSRDNCNAIIESSSNTLLYGCQKTIIPNSVTTIGARAFCGCSNLTSINIPNSVTSIGAYAFQSCNSLTSITIPNGVTSIGEGAFDECRGLTSITIPESVTLIGERAFKYCSGLKKAEFASIEQICKIEFKDNESNPLAYAHHLYVNGIEVVDAVIPNGVTSIGFAAFSGCTGLTSVTIPNSVKFVYAFAFKGCTGLTTIYCLAKTPPSIYNPTFQGVDKTWIDLYVPFGSIWDYKTAEYWKDFEYIKSLDATSITQVERYNAIQNSRYDLSGRQQTKSFKGINIIRISDGTTKKLLVK